MKEEKCKKPHRPNFRPLDEEILEAKRLYEEEGWTMREIGEKFDRSQSNISVWINKFAKELDNPDMNKKKLRATRQRERAKRKYGVLAPERTPHPDEQNESQTTESVEQRIKRLEKELADARLARDFYNEMINVAERQFNISIRKKAGTRQ